MLLQLKGTVAQLEQQLTEAHAAAAAGSAAASGTAAAAAKAEHSAPTSPIAAAGAGEELAAMRAKMAKAKKQFQVGAGGGLWVGVRPARHVPAFNQIEQVFAAEQQGRG